MRNMRSWMCGVGCLMAIAGAITGGANPARAEEAKWTPAGWGGGGFFFAAAFDPARDGVIYLGGDVNGVYKTEDHGKTWRIINRGLANYGVYSLAVDRKNPQTVYAAHEAGLSKSTDGGATWAQLPKTGRKELRITGERNKSTRAIAVDPTDSNIVYAASPGGKIYKSTDGGQNWIVSYEKSAANESPEDLRIQFGKATGEWFGGFWLPIATPEALKPDAIKSTAAGAFGFTFQGDGTAPREAFLTLKTKAGPVYRTRNIGDLFAGKERRDVLFTAADLVLDPEYLKKNPAAATDPKPIDWADINRLDFTIVGALPTEAYVGRFSQFFFGMGEDGKASKVTARDFKQNKTVAAYGNARAAGTTGAASMSSVAVAEKDPSRIIAASEESGLLLSTDAGKSWTPLDTPKRASSAVFAPTDPNILFGSFYKDGIWRSTDAGKTWTHVSKGLPAALSALEVAVSPANARDVYLIGAVEWDGTFCYSNDGGDTWKPSSSVAIDLPGNPTLPESGPKTPLSRPTNIAINPQNPQQIFISANWRNVLSDDGGRTWHERARGADITVVTDIRFSGQKTYVSAMDEGTLVTEDGGKVWKQLWPMKWTPGLSGHYWRLAVTSANGVDRIISTSSPWDDKHPNQVVLSTDGGQSFTVAKQGLPTYIPKANTMWGRGYARALAVDPKNPQVVYLGIDGDPADSGAGGNAGGGLFKSEDGGNNWTQLPKQPGSRRMFFGLAVDPTDSKRLYWGACGTGGGLYRSEDGGASWELAFGQDTWIFNVHVTADGTVYCPGKNLFRSTDHGRTWKQITQFEGNRAIVGLETHPTDPKTMWISLTTWDNNATGSVQKTTDGGATWTDITGDLPYVKPMILRYNPATSELWAGSVGLYRIKQ